MRLRACLPFLMVAVGCASAPPSSPTGAPPTPSAAASVTPVPSAHPTPPPPMPTAVPTVPPPAAMPTADTDPPLVRVLLKRSSAGISLPQPGRAYWVSHDGGGLWLWGPIEIRVAVAGTRMWQVGAWSEPANAALAVKRIKQAFGPAVDVREEPTANGLIRVRAGWITDEPNDPTAAFAGLGFDGVYAAPSTGVLRLEGADHGVVTSPAEVTIDAAGDWPVVVGSRSYRGRLRARAVGGEALVINELNMESYLKGVVPLEMGPSRFPELDALKAQAVAARTYAVAHLGDHADEGWDLCATPACQVYGGVSGEHSLSDRAVVETAGLVAVYEGRPINAMYTSTCGGHTENVEELFGDRAQPYLKGVACAWERPLLVGGNGTSGEWVGSTAFSAEVAREVLVLEADANPAEILGAVLRKSEVTAHLLAPVDVESYSYAILTAAGVDPPAGVAPQSGGLDRLLFLADLFKAPLDPPVSGLAGDWPAAAALTALELRGDVVRDSGEAIPRPGGVGIFPRRAEHGEDLPMPVPLWERWGGGYRRRASTEMQPGTALERLRDGDQVVALVVRRSGGGGEADRRSAWREWVREHSWSDLERMLGVAELERLQVTRRSPSGRVVGLTAIDRSGAVKEWTGFDVRRALELPETLFAMHLRTRPDGERAVHFLGRGWGHGVGLCQNGAYGLARAGRQFEDILGHYYTGIQVVRWRNLEDGLQSTEP